MIKLLSIFLPFFRRYTAIATVIILCAPWSAYAIELSFPLDCSLHKDCFIQRYVDMAPQSLTYGARDYRCRPTSSTRHQGTDIRLSNMVDIQRNISVRAAANGTVIAVRNKFTDIPARFNINLDKKDVCGNAVIIDHGEGWQSVYCHLRQNSISVKKGDNVSAGTTIAQIGISGQSNFPHLHFQVNYYDIPVDPFSGKTLRTGCSPDNTIKAGLWSKKAHEHIGTDDTTSAILNHGFSNHAPSITEARGGIYNHDTMSFTGNKLYLWTEIMNPMKGNTLRLEITSPDNRTKFKDYTLNKTTDIRFEDISFPRPESGWISGKYTGQISLLQNNRVIIQRTTHTNFSPSAVIGKATKEGIKSFRSSSLELLKEISPSAGRSIHKVSNRLVSAN